VIVLSVTLFPGVVLHPGAVLPDFPEAVTACQYASPSTKLPP
jgi:hypothetical protein